MKHLAVILAILFLAFSNIQAQWLQTNGPEGGLIRNLVSTSKYILCGNEGGVFRLAKDSTVWIAKNEGRTYTAVSHFAIRDSLLFAGGFSGVYRSTDWGDSWTAVSSGIENIFVTEIISTDSGLFAGTISSGVYRSTNDGMSWTPANVGISTALVDELTAFIDASGCLNLLAETRHSGNVFRSTDAGATWTTTTWGRYVVAVHSPSGPILVATTSKSGVRTSTDLGTTWITVNSTFNKVGKGLVATSNNLLFSLTRNGLYRSSDIGVTWDTITTNIGNSCFLSLLPDSTGPTMILYAGTQGGVYRSSDLGAHWEECNAGLVNTSISSLATRPEPGGGTKIIAGTDGGLASTTDGGSTWTKVNPGTADGTFYALHAPTSGRDSGYVYAGSMSMGVFRSDDGGETWSLKNSGIPTHSDRIEVASFASSDTMIFAAETWGVFASSDHGETWTAISSKFLWSFSLLATRTPSGTPILLAGNYRANIYPAGILATTDNGTYWAPMNQGLPASVIWSIVRIDTFLFAATDSGVYRKGFGEEAWQHKSSGLTNQYVTPLIVIDNTLYAGTADGVFQSMDLGTSWTRVGEGLRNTVVLALAAVPSSVSTYQVFAGTFGGGGGIGAQGMWQMTFSYRSTFAEDQIQRLPLSFGLQQNYPNPFNPETKIEFGIQKSEFTRLTVSDILGREVVVLVNEEKMPGTYTATWNAEGMASGVYLYRLQAGEYVETKKLILMR